MQEHQDQIPVHIDRDIYETLKARSTFEDTFSSVLRRELGLPEVDVRGGRDEDRRLSEASPPPRPSGARARPKGKSSRTMRARAAAGTLLPENVYHRPILEILAEHDGQLPKQAVIDELGNRLSDRLTDADRDNLESGGIRWQSRAQFARLRLAERGLIDKSAPRGIWAITAEGTKALEEGTI